MFDIHVSQYVDYGIAPARIGPAGVLILEFAGPNGLRVIDSKSRGRGFKSRHRFADVAQLVERYVLNHIPTPGKSQLVHILHRFIWRPLAAQRVGAPPSVVVSAFPTKTAQRRCREFHGRAGPPDTLSGIAPAPETR